MSEQHPAVRFDGQDVALGLITGSMALLLIVLTLWIALR
jgi:hypothetical protein